MKSKLIVALDVDSFDRASALVRELRDAVGRPIVTTTKPVEAAQRVLSEIATAAST